MRSEASLKRLNRPCCRKVRFCNEDEKRGVQKQRIVPALTPEAALFSPAACFSQRDEECLTLLPPVSAENVMENASLVVIWLSPHDGHGPIELLDKDESYHLVGEGHLGERQLLAGFGIHVGRKAVGPSDDEDEALADGLNLLLHVPGEFDAAQFPAVLVEKDHVVAWLELLEDEFAFLLLLLFGRQVLGVLQLWDGCDVEADIVLETG